MLWLGFLLPIVFVAGWTGASIPTQWPLLSAVLPIMMLWRRGPIGYVHLLGICFISYAALSLTWAANFYDAGHGLWIIMIWALSFWLGSSENSLTSLWKGLALGMAVNSAVAISQHFGHDLVLNEINAVTSKREYYSPGLLFNTTVSGAVAALILIGLVSHRLWFYIPCAAPSLVLSHSRGAWLALAIALAAKYLHWKICLLILVMVTLAFLFHPVESDQIRLATWRIAGQHLSWFGRGVESFSQVWVWEEHRVLRMEHAHNDYIELVFEYGIGVIFIFGVMAAAIAVRAAPDWPIFVAFACLGLFWFPLYSPIPAFIGAVVAGHLVRDRYLFRGYGIRGRPDLVPGHPRQESALVHGGPQAIPVGS